MKTTFVISVIKDQGGAVAIIVGLSLFMLVGFGAMGVDIGNLCVAKNELQNAADAGALAGAQDLYNSDGTALNVNANQIARDAALANMSQGTPVDVNWTGGNIGDVQRGHWSFATRTFTPNDSLAPVDLWNVSSEELDLNPNFINAVRVVTRRQATPIQSFLARVLGRNSFQLSAEAVAYIGFAGTLTPYDVDQPIAICEDKLTIDEEYTCNVGRMINSGQDPTTNETGGWTSFNQDNPCEGGTNASEMKSLICSGGNGSAIFIGEDVATNGGEIQSAFDKLYSCWESATDKTRPWNITLPVILCDDSNVGPCNMVTGAVNLNVIWITDNGTPKFDTDAPTQMAGIDGGVAGDWNMSSEPNGITRWENFASHFRLLNGAGEPCTRDDFIQKCIYFLPDCTPHIPAGISGGRNFGILAKIPVLVR